MNPETLPKRLTQRQGLIFLLRDGKWHGVKELRAAAGWRYSARLHELKQAGYVIERRHVIADFYEWRWSRSPGQLRLAL